MYIVQDVLYGRPHPRSFKILCEDDVSEGMLAGMLDYTIPRLNWHKDSIRVVRNTGADQFPTHASAFAKCRMLDQFVFVLDGDQRGRAVAKKLKNVTENLGVPERPVIYLPGDSPEQWIWERLEEGSFETELGVTAQWLSKRMKHAEALFGHASNPKNEIYKAMLEDVTHACSRSVPELCRIVARKNIEIVGSDLRPIEMKLKEAFEKWRHTQMNF